MKQNINCFLREEKGCKSGVDGELFEIIPQNTHTHSRGDTASQPAEQV